MIIRNSHLIDPKSGTDGARDIRINDENGTISDISTAGTLMPENEEEVIDADGIMAVPGLVDGHGHFRDPGFTDKEDILNMIDLPIGDNKPFKHNALWDALVTYKCFQKVLYVNKIEGEEVKK